jgi:endoglucanase
MTKTLLIVVLLLANLLTFGQTEERIPIVSVTPSENTGQDYSSWLSDDLNNLIPAAWQDNFKWVDVTLKLNQKSVVTRLSFYDYEGVFTDKPAYIYAMNGTQKIFLGTFQGLTYMTFVDLKLPQGLVADAIVIHKYCNNIPQKVKVFGQPITSTSVLPVIEDRITLASVSPSENTGMDYTPWLNDDLSKMVESAWTGNSKWVDVTIKLSSKAIVNKVKLYDYTGVFTDYPATIYALNGTQKTLIGTFDGPTYMNWINYSVPSVLADAIVVHKFGNNIPQKVNVYGQAVLTDPLDVPPLPSEIRINITAATPSENTGMDYSSWLTDNLANMIPSVWGSANSKWVNVTLPFDKRSQVYKVSLYDYTGVFTDYPATVYAVDGTNKILIGTFDGSTYMNWINYLPTAPITADALLIHKYGNNVPQKVKAFGTAVSTTVVTPPTTTTPTTPTTTPTPTTPTVTGTKIPLDAKRWYILNNAANGLDALVDGKTDAEVFTGWGKLLSNYDAYYPLLEGEEISLQSVKFFDGQGVIKDYPMTLSVITDTWKRIPVAKFTGETYMQWVGPNPSNPSKFTLDSVVQGKVRYLVVNTYDGFPREMELYGTYKVSTKAVTPVPVRETKLKNGFGMNGFEWDFLDIWGYTIDEVKMKPIKTFSGFRHYMDWDKLEHLEGLYTYSPTMSGGWNYDAVYERCKAEGIEVLACLQTMPPWMEATYPSTDHDRDYVPVRYGKDFTNPTSYIDQAKAAFQYTARYGRNTLVNPSLLVVYDKPRWTADHVNSIRIGLNTIKYIECGNERDKWWKGRQGYQTAREYAANLSAFYDGHKNTMGVGVGVKNADPTMKVVMTGLASASVDYLKGMIDWCKEFRGYNADGTVNVCWDVINYHYYSNNSNSSQNGIATRGNAPEISTAGQVATDFVKVAHSDLNDMPIWVTELGYDANQGSPYKAIPIGTKTEYITQADWSLRSSLLYNRLGIDRCFFYELYDDNFPNPTQFASSGLINQDRSRKPVADYMYQATQLVGDYVYKETLSKDPIVDRYELNGKSAYILYIPDEIGRTGTYNLALSGTTKVNIYTPLAGSDTMSVVHADVTQGHINVNISETPIFILPNTSSARLAVAEKPSELFTSLQIFPNPTSETISFSLENEETGSVQANIYDAKSNLVKQASFVKTGTRFSESINIANLPNGLYLMQINQGERSIIKKVIKVN